MLAQRMRGPILLLLLLTGCASTPPEDLVWSTPLANSLRTEMGATVEVARFSRLAPGPVGNPWEPFLVLRGNAPTQYALVPLNGTVVLSADAQEGGSGVYRKIRVDPKRHPIIEFRWQVPPREEGASPFDVAARASPMTRLSLAFHGDPAKLDFEDRTKLRLAKMLTVNGLPYASLLYVWMHNVPVDTVLHSPHTDRVRMIVVESGAKRVGEWIEVRRNVLEDYRRVYGEEPDHIVAVGLMTDPGDDGSRRRALYGDITFRSAQ